MEALDQVHLAFDPASLRVLNLVLALIMFGVALDLRLADFGGVLKQPRAVVAGLLGQLVLLPAMTLGLILVIAPPPSVALGMIIVAACPGGNVSNLFTHLARGNTSLSITMTAITTVSALVITPLNLAFWGSLAPGVSGLLRAIALDPIDMITAIGLILGVPLILGMVMASRLPGVAARLRGPMRGLSMLALAGFIVAALAKNFGAFVDHLPAVLALVAVHNALAFLLGNLTARAFRLAEPDRRALTVEVGIQNSGLGLILIFDFFTGLGGAAFIAATWGVQHLLAGSALVAYWSRRRSPAAAAAPAA
ncbi:MAG: bile acid:sodium symporter family protein [Nannocystaceae bacterium]